MALPALHRALDRLAMWVEDRVEREPEGFREGPAGPLACFGPLGDLPPSPAGAGTWSFPSPAGGPGDRISLRVEAARGARRGTALLVPPWKLPSPRFLGGWIRLLSRSGLDVWLVTPPHHLERAGPGERRGEGFVSPDLSRLRRSLEQLVLEIRLCARLAAGRGEVGVVGLSLGALGAALAATGPEPLDFAALVAPPGDLAAILEETPIGRRYAALARRAGSPLPPRPGLRAALAPFDPAGRPPTARRILVAAGLHDRIVLGGPERLARAWGLASRAYPRGHLTLLFGCRALRRDLGAFLRGGYFLREAR